MTVSPLIAALICFVAYILAYQLYAKHLANRLFELDPSKLTPAHRLRDQVDYVPTNRYVLFGHHYASITGLSPMLGPAIAVIWGWFPAMLWVVLGTIFVGAVHDFGSLAISIRAQGFSIGKITESLVGPRAKTLFHAIIFFLVALAMGVFVHIVATLFSPEFYPESVVPSTLPDPNGAGRRNSYLPLQLGNTNTYSHRVYCVAILNVAWHPLPNNWTFINTMEVVADSVRIFCKCVTRLGIAPAT